MHPMSKISDIANRIPDVDIKEIRKQLYNMIGTDIEKEGTRFDSKYYIKQWHKKKKFEKAKCVKRPVND